MQKTNSCPRPQSGERAKGVTNMFVTQHSPLYQETFLAAFCDCPCSVGLFWIGCFTMMDMIMLGKKKGEQGISRYVVARPHLDSRRRRVCVRERVDEEMFQEAHD